jgi:p-hydroxybenzoate 3-monooxygenase
MTNITHRFSTNTPFDERVRTTELEYLLDSSAAQTVWAENFVGSAL